MPPDSPLRSRRSRPWYATDSGRAGLVLSAVTIAVLAIGFAVIQSTRSNDDIESTSNRKSAETAIPAPAEPNTREEIIVLSGSAPSPTQLPATSPQTSVNYPPPKYGDEGATLPFTAERPRDAATDRL